MAKLSLAALSVMTLAACAPHRYFVDDVGWQWTCDGATFEAMDRGGLNDVVITFNGANHVLLYEKQDRQEDRVVDDYSDGVFRYRITQDFRLPLRTPGRFEAALEGPGVKLDHCTER